MLKHHHHVATVARLPLGLCAKDVGQVTEVHKKKTASMLEEGLSGLQQYSACEEIVQTKRVFLRSM